MTQEYFLQVIGSGDAFNHGNKLHTSFYYHTPSHNFLIDCGATTLLGLRQNEISTEEIDTIIITHLHGDHFAGLPFLLLEMHKICSRSKPLQVILPAGGKQKLEELFWLLYPGAEDTLQEIPINFVTTNRAIELNEFKISAVEVVHTPHLECYGISIADDHKKLAYSGDTEWTDSLIQLSENADLFLCECNFFEQNFNGHLNYLHLSKHLNRLCSKNTLITHAGKSMLEQKGLRIPIAEDGKIYNL